jgi:hypothetical protein
MFWGELGLYRIRAEFAVIWYRTLCLLVPYEESQKPRNKEL